MKNNNNNEKNEEEEKDLEDESIPVIWDSQAGGGEILSVLSGRDSVEGQESITTAGSLGKGCQREAS